jgi:hypothetical protein
MRKLSDFQIECILFFGFLIILFVGFMIFAVHEI